MTVDEANAQLLSDVGHVILVVGSVLCVALVAFGVIQTVRSSRWWCALHGHRQTIGTKGARYAGNLRCQCGDQRVTWEPSTRLWSYINEPEPHWSEIDNPTFQRLLQNRDAYIDPYRPYRRALVDVDDGF